MTTVVLATLVAAAIGLALGLLIGVMAKRFAVEIDPRIEEVAGMLPGANCGGCGYASCMDMAKSIVCSGNEPGSCPVCPSESIAKIASFLGRAAGAKERQVAVVLCGGSEAKASRAGRYNGVNDCRSAMLVAGGGKSCKYGCLGYASCAKACPFGAIELRDGLAKVHPEICVGCGKCVAACPRKLIKLVPASVKVHIHCSSPEKGPLKKKSCSVPCIACRKCVKVAGEGQMVASGFLVQVNYANPPGPEIVEKAGCPTGCLVAVEDLKADSGKEAAA